jgi:hypothetical protein
LHDKAAVAGRAAPTTSERTRGLTALRVSRTRVIELRYGYEHPPLGVAGMASQHHV